MKKVYKFCQKAKSRHKFFVRESRAAAAIIAALQEGETVIVVSGDPPSLTLRQKLYYPIAYIRFMYYTLFE